MKTFRIVNYDGDIEVCIFKKANAVFHTNEYDETTDACICRETFNIFELINKYEKLQQENKQLKDNWNKLKVFLQEDYDYYDKYGDAPTGYAMGQINKTKNKMQELEKGSDSNE